MAVLNTPPPVLGPCFSMDVLGTATGLFTRVPNEICNDLYKLNGQLEYCNHTYPAPVNLG